MKNNIKKLNSNKIGFIQIMVLIIAIILIICLGVNLILNSNKKYKRKSNIYEIEQEEKKEINSVNITKKNWNQFFEFADVETWRYNDFDEICGITLNKVIRLKSDYYGKIASESKIAFEISGIIKDKILDVDYKNKKYSIKNKTWTGGLGKGINQTETTSLILSESFFKDGAIIYLCNDGYFTINGKKVLTIDVIEELKVIRAKGTLYLYN